MRALKFNQAAALIVALLMMAALCGCSGKQAAKSVDNAAQKTAAAAETETASRSVRPVVQDDDSTDEDNGTVIAFGADTAFGGIAMETDENGELVYQEADGAVWYKVTDERFTSYRKLRRFVNGKIDSKFMTQISSFFVEKDSELYFVDGVDGREIASSKRYYFNNYDAKGDDKITLSASHTPECRKKYGLSRSHIDFVKTSGQWKLDTLTLFDD